MKQPPKNRTRIRLTIDLEPSVYETFHDLAQTTRQGMGRTIGDWLLDTQEAAQHVVGLVKDARSQPALAAQRLHSYAVGLSTVTEQLVEDAKAGRPPTGAGSAGTARSGGRAGSASPVTPRSVIRGETSPTKGKK